MVSSSDLGPEGREFEPWPMHPRCVLRQNTQLSQCLSLPRAELFEAWLALTSVKYHDNLLILILINQWLALTMLRTTGPRCISGNQQIAWGQPDKKLGGNLRWTSIPSRRGVEILLVASYYRNRR